MKFLKTLASRQIRAGVLAIILLSNCGEQPNENQNQAAATEKPPAEVSSKFDLAYSGILPCKDCEGVQTALLISSSENSFLYKEEYKGSNAPTFIKTGPFNTEKGYKDDKDATLYILGEDLPGLTQLYFVRLTGKDGLL